jgi:hypothetical protein
LPNSGKTSLFNALTESHAEITSYAAVQASANVGIAEVPDERIAALARAVSARDQVPATVQFSDVAGLVRGSGARDGGLGGEYLGHLRATDALAHVVRVFDDEAVSHPDGRIDPVLDAEAVDFELLLSDQILVARRAERAERAARVGEKSARDELAVLERLTAHLDQGLPARTLDVEIPEGLDLLTTKPVIYVANVSEVGEPERVAALTAYATERGAEVVAVVTAVVRKYARRRARGPRRSGRLPRRSRPRGAGNAAPGARLLPHARPDHVLHRRTDGGARLAGARGRQRARGRRQDPLGHRARIHPRGGDPLGRSGGVRVAHRGAEARPPARRGPRLRRGRRRRAEHPLQHLIRARR